VSTAALEEREREREREEVSDRLREAVASCPGVRRRWKGPLHGGIPAYASVSRFESSARVGNPPWVCTDRDPGRRCGRSR
jgi:hypothetical protein